MNHMRNSHLSILWRIVALAGIVSLSFLAVSNATADSGDQPAPEIVFPDSDAAEKETGLQRVEFEASSAPVLNSLPDEYGYTWDDQQPYGWLDISGSGTTANLDDVDDGFDGPINLGFDFQFYEKTYNQVYISSNGFLTFEAGSKNAKNEKIPFVDEPNALIAPFWDDLEVGRRNDGSVLYQSFSDHFVVTFSEIASRATPSDLITFQVILYNTGKICFQYNDLNGQLDSATVGIEDRDGVTGLAYLYNADGLADLEGTHALCFTRPADAYRTKVIPEFQGGFVGEQNAFEIEVINTGDLGPDAFDLEIQQTNSDWAIELYDQSGNPITKDTNTNGIVETPILAEGESFIVVVKAIAPEDAEVGSNTIIDLISASLGNSAQQRTAKIQTAVPASFVQSLTTRVRIDLRMITASQTRVKTVFPLFTGSTLGMQQYNDYNYMVFWERNGQKTDPGGVGLYIDIEHAVSNDIGMTVLPAVKTTDNADATTSSWWIYDSNPVSAVTADGRIALVWIRDIYDFSDPLVTKTNSNVYLVILDQADTQVVISGPINLTHNTQWDGTGELNIPHYFTPHLAATPDNRFTVVWTEEKVADALGTTLSNIHWAVYNSSGNAIVPAQKYDQLDSTVVNGLFYQDPAVYGLNNGQVILAFSQRGTGVYQPGYAILGTNGTTQFGPTYLAGVQGRYPIPRQLSSGAIVYAMTLTDQPQIAFTIISNSTYAYGPVTDLAVLDDLASDYVSVTESKEGYGILTWLDTDLERTIYYALIGADGSILTNAMPFYKADVDNSIAISESGRGNAPYDPRMAVYLPLISR